MVAVLALAFWAFSSALCSTEDGVATASAGATTATMEQPRWVREKIDRLCRECGGEHAKALHAVLCTRESVTAIALRHHVSESVLYERRKTFYESWYKKR